MADNPMGEPQVAAVLGKIAAYAPGIGGAILSMAFTEGMKPWEKAMGVGIGLAMAFWFAPGFLALDAIWWPALAKSPQYPQILSMTGAFFALFGMTLATFVRRLLTTLKIQLDLGPLKINQDGEGAP